MEALSIRAAFYIFIVIIAPILKKIPRNIHRWWLELQEFSFTLQYPPGRNMYADVLSRLLSEELENSPTYVNLIKIANLI